MQIFQDYIQLKQAENSLAKLTALREQGEIDLKSFYAKKKALSNTTQLNYDRINKKLYSQANNSLITGGYKLT